VQDLTSSILDIHALYYHIITTRAASQPDMFASAQLHPKDTTNNYNGATSADQALRGSVQDFTSPLESLLTNNRPFFENASPTGRIHVPGQVVKFAAWTRNEYPSVEDVDAVG
jgi:hypothetical protein